MRRTDAIELVQMLRLRGVKSTKADVYSESDARVSGWYGDRRFVVDEDRCVRAGNDTCPTESGRGWRERTVENVCRLLGITGGEP